MAKDITSTRSMPLEVGEDYEMGWAHGKTPEIGEKLLFNNVTLNRSWEVRVVDRWQDRKKFTIEVLKEL